MQARILIIDDEETIRWFCTDALTPHGYTVVTAATAEDGIAQAEQEEFDAILTDIRLDGISGLEALRQFKQMPTTRDTPVIIMTGYASMETAVEALRGGAYDYLQKPLELQVLLHTVGRALELTRLRREVRWLRDQSLGENDLGMGPLIGIGVKMRQLYQTLQQIAPMPTGCVLITGETGTGKGLIARTLHNLSPSATGPFIHVNCSAIPSDLFETELFGHEPGAFTDARQRRVGHVESAHGGTLFLDEIGDVPLTLQAKLLHVIEDKVVQRLGAERPTRVEVRIIAATNRPLGRMAEDGTFRQDLLYRLNTIPIAVPPLRERPEDLLPLAKHFLDLFNQEFNKSVRSVSPEAERELLAHSWPGNVRELRNVIERAVLFESGQTLSNSHLYLSAPYQPPAPTLLPQKPLRVAYLNREMVEQALVSSGGNKSRAAALLGVSRPTLYKKMQEFGLA